MCIGFIWLRIVASGMICENDNEPSYSIKGEELLDYVSDY
jgi:hypothetical protein